MLCHLCMLGDPQHRGTKSELAASTLPSRGPKRGRKCYVTPAFLGIPNKGEQNKIRSGYLTPAFFGAQKRAEMLCHPCILGGTQRQAGGRNPQSSYTANSILGTVHKGTICGGEEAQKDKNSNKNRGKGVYRGIRYIKIACVYVPLYCLYSRIITQTACCRARRRRRRISTPNASMG